MANFLKFGKDTVVNVEQITVALYDPEDAFFRIFTSDKRYSEEKMSRKEADELLKKLTSYPASRCNLNKTWD